MIIDIHNERILLIYAQYEKSGVLGGSRPTYSPKQESMDEGWF